MRKPGKPASKEAALEMLRQGKTRKEIAVAFNCTVGWTYDLIRGGMDGFCTLSPRAQAFLHKTFQSNRNMFHIKTILNQCIQRRDITDRSHRNVGRKTYEELCEWCGYKRPIHKPSAAVSNIRS